MEHLEQTRIDIACKATSDINKALQKLSGAVPELFEGSQVLRDSLFAIKCSNDIICKSMMQEFKLPDHWCNRHNKPCNNEVNDFGSCGEHKTGCKAREILIW